MAAKVKITITREDGEILEMLTATATDKGEIEIAQKVMSALELSTGLMRDGIEVTDDLLDL